jgi:hypothetical protein
VLYSLLYGRPVSLKSWRQVTLRRFIGRIIHFIGRIIHFIGRIIRFIGHIIRFIGHII